MPESEKVAALRSVELDVRNLAEAVAFLSGPWGLRSAGTDDGTTYLAGTGTDNHCVALREEARPAIRSMTFRARSAAAIETALRDAEAAGATALDGPRPASDPAGGTEGSFRDPQGRRVRLVHGDRREAAAVPQPDLPVGLTHVNFNSADIDAALAFYCRVLDFSLTGPTTLSGTQRRRRPSKRGLPRR